MSTSTPHSPLESLREEHKAMVYLVEIIKQEQAQLLEANIEALKQLTEEKSKVVAQMSEFATQRDQALSAAGFTGKDIQLWLGKIGANASKVWEELMSLATSAKELNRINGMLINKHMTHNQSALQALHVAPQGGNLYGPTGQASAKTSSRRLVVG